MLTKKFELVDHWELKVTKTTIHTHTYFRPFEESTLVRKRLRNPFALISGFSKKLTGSEGRSDNPLIYFFSCSLLLSAWYSCDNVRRTWSFVGVKSLKLYLGNWFVFVTGIPVIIVFTTLIITHSIIFWKLHDMLISLNLIDINKRYYMLLHNFIS